MTHEERNAIREMTQNLKDQAEHPEDCLCIFCENRLRNEMAEACQPKD